MARGATIFCGIIVVGQIVFGIGGFFRLIWLMNIGRFIFGMGSEAIWTVQSVYAASWFFGKQLNFVFVAHEAPRSLKPLTDYFNRYWMTKVKWTLWNVSDVELKTNNIVEG
ncbi:unnamed protein product [Rotaria sp. Silwood1]|nr:unnamed protein product [Rotaria sp. Silwood1]